LVYLDYSATTPVNKKVLELFYNDNLSFFANANSTHALGKTCNLEIIKATKGILSLMNLETHEIVYTSGASEANNLAIKGVVYQNITKGKHIITSAFEHSSITTTLNYLTKQGFDIDVVDSDDDGIIDLNELEALIRDDTTLVTIGAVNSETGIVQDIEAISKLLSKYPNTIFHSDMTQAIGKINLDYSLVDLISFSAHKFYGIKGVGGLFVRRMISLTPQIHGGKSTSKFRAGTPALPLILSVKNALELALEDFDKKLLVIKNLHDYLLNKIKKIDNVEINSNMFSLNQIVNISFLDILSNRLHKQLSDKEIFVSTTTACASERPESLTVKRLTGSIERAETAIRVSISHLTTKKEIDQFVNACKEIIKHENN
jgi:cysteine desulfurase